MIPIQDVIPTSRTPLVTIVLVGLNLLGFLYQHFVSNAATTSLLAVALFTHAGVAHLTFNLLLLWLFGDNIEERLGRATLLFCYVGCGVAGTVIQTFLDRTTGASPVGASAAIAGVVGAYFVLLPEAKVLVFVPVPLSVVELPAVFFLAMFWVLQGLTFVVTPSAAGSDASPAAHLLPLVIAFGLGAALSGLRRKPVVW